MLKNGSYKHHGKKTFKNFIFEKLVLHQKDLKSIRGLLN